MRVEIMDWKVKRVPRNEVESYNEHTRNAWIYTDPKHPEIPVVIEFREYFDNWNDVLDEVYVVHYDEDAIKNTEFDYDEYEFSGRGSFTKAKAQAIEMLKDID